MYKLRDWIQVELLDWDQLSANPKAVHLLNANPDRINWFKASQNPLICLLDVLGKDLDWYSLSANPGALHLLEANPDKINWEALSFNQAAIHILEANQDKIDWRILSENYEIFEYDYESMTRPFFEELMANRFHPNNLDKFEAWGYE